MEQFICFGLTFKVRVTNLPGNNGLHIGHSTSPSGTAVLTTASRFSHAKLLLGPTIRTGMQALHQPLNERPGPELLLPSICALPTPNAWPRLGLGRLFLPGNHFIYFFPLNRKQTTLCCPLPVCYGCCKLSNLAIYKAASS